MHDAYIPTFFTRHNSPLRGVMLSWQSQRLTLLEWQGELWMPWEQVPRYMKHPTNQ